MRFALLTETTSLDGMWSGTVAHMVRALRAAGQEVDILPAPLLAPMAQGARTLARLQRRLLHRDAALDRTVLFAQMKARAIHRILSRAAPADALLAPVASTMLPFVRTEMPVVYVSDATLPLMLDYYDRFRQIPPQARDRIVGLEKLALEKADLAVFPTGWAAASARDDHGVPPERLLVASFGPNLSRAPTRARALAPRRAGPVRLLFCAVEWARKGGDVIAGMTRALEARGVPAELLVIGVEPPAEAALPDWVKVVPHLDKSDPRQRDLLHEAFLHADLLLLPSRAECYGMVLCEAAAHGTPALATRTGGIPEVVEHGRSGLLMAPGDDGAAYAAAVAELSGDADRLHRMSVAARDAFEARLNWGAWAEAVVARTRALLPREAA